MLKQPNLTILSHSNSVTLRRVRSMKEEEGVSCTGEKLLCSGGSPPNDTSNQQKRGCSAAWRPRDSPPSRPVPRTSALSCKACASRSQRGRNTAAWALTEPVHVHAGARSRRFTTFPETCWSSPGGSAAPAPTLSREAGGAYPLFSTRVLPCSQIRFLFLFLANTY